MSEVETSFYVDFDGGDKTIYLYHSVSQVKCPNGEPIYWDDDATITLTFKERGNSTVVDIDSEYYKRKYQEAVASLGSPHIAFLDIVSQFFDYATQVIEYAESQLCDCSSCREDRYYAICEDKLDAIRVGEY